MAGMLKLKMNVYRADELDAYTTSKEDELLAAGAQAPTAKVAEIRIDPSDIVAYFQVYSIKESTYENPIFDQVCIVTRNGSEFNVNITIQELDEMIEVSTAAVNFTGYSYVIPANSTNVQTLIPKE